MNLAKYRSHKVVAAGRVIGTDPGAPGALALLVEQADGSSVSVECDLKMFARYVPVPGDYYVVYEDGYASISPQKAFEDGYTKIEAA